MPKRKVIQFLRPDAQSQAGSGEGGRVSSTPCIGAHGGCASTGNPGAATISQAETTHNKPSSPREDVQARPAAPGASFSTPHHTGTAKPTIGKLIADGGLAAAGEAFRKKWYAGRPALMDFEAGVDRFRIVGFLTRRQYGKTSEASRISLKKMMAKAGHTVVFGSVKLDLGREIIRKESEAIQKSIRVLSEFVWLGGESVLDVVDVEKNRSVANFKPDDFAEIYQAQRLEFRLWHDRTTYSRTKVVALTPAAVGETGDLILDEVGRVKNFREVWEAVKPIIASQPEFRLILTTTPPPDDAHYSFELLAPPIDAELPINARGNWYRSELGVRVLRVTAWDAAAGGLPLYDDETGAAVSPEESRAKDPDKDAWDRNYGCKFVLGGTAAVGLMQLDAAQRRGIGQCACVVVDADIDFDRGLEFLRAHLEAGPVGLGWDLATTESESSNPSSFTVAQRRGLDFVGVCTFVWKTRDPALAKERARRIIDTVATTPSGRARRLCIDSSNELYFAEECRKEFGGAVPVELVKGGETKEVPGGDPIPMKVFLGNLLVAEIDDNRAVLAPERYLKDDFRLVRRDRGSFSTEIGTSGQHGDTFDSHKLALWALQSSAGALQSVEGIRIGGGLGRVPRFQPRRL